MENVEILKVSENACFFVVAYWCRSVWGRGIFTHLKIRYGGQGTTRANYRKDPVIMTSLLRLLRSSEVEDGFNAA